MKPKLGLVGAGRWGSTVAERIYREGVAEIAVVYDKDSNKSKSLATRIGATAIDDLDGFEKRRDLLGIIVATSIESLAEVSMRIIELGFNVLIEKPVADSLEKVRGLRRAAERKGIIAMPGFIVRFDPVSMWMKKYIESMEDGIEDLYLFRFSRRPPQNRLSNILLDLAIHDIDLARHLLLEDLELVSWYIHNLDIDQAVSIYAKHRRGYIYIGVDGISRQKVRKAIAVSTQSYIEGDYINQYVILKTGGWNAHKYIEVKGSEALLNEIRAFIERCRGRDIEIPTLLDAEKAHEIISLIMNTRQRS
ncbi:MAG: Gfo/Idh/MocA family oxidoreductase [Desulfurococcales archaeon]|nr:Gfo/Idh/MocA family oxidoreductase [Desulfurococcales archaeon]